jgi:hypothetical protein
MSKEKKPGKKNNTANTTCGNHSNMRLFWFVSLPPAHLTPPKTKISTLKFQILTPSHEQHLQSTCEIN